MRKKIPTLGAQVVLLLRQPTGRAYSAFQHHCRKGRFYDGRDGPIFSLEADPAAYAGRKRLAAPCAAEAFEAFLGESGAPLRESRIVTWGRYQCWNQSLVDGRLGISSNPSTSLKSNSFSMILEPLILASRVLDD